MSRPARLLVVLVLNLGLVTGLVIVGLSAHSLGALAEGADYLADAAGIAVALLAIRLSHRPATASRPYGHGLATTIAALVNAGWLLVLSLLVIAGGIDRLLSTIRPVHGLAVLIVSGVAALVMLAGALVLADDLDAGEDGDLSLQAVLLDSAADAASAAGVAVTGGIIAATGGLYWLDPVVALTISTVVAYHAVRLLRRVFAALAVTDRNSQGERDI